MRHFVEPSNWSQLAILAALAGPWLLLPFAVVFSWIDNLAGRRRMRNLGAKQKRPEGEQTSRPEAAPDAAIPLVVQMNDGKQHPVYAQVSVGLEQPPRPWEVYSPVWCAADGPPNVRQRAELQAAGLSRKIGPNGQEAFYRTVRLPGRMRLNELKPFMEGVAQDAYQLRRRIKSERTR